MIGAMLLGATSLSDFSLINLTEIVLILLLTFITSIAAALSRFINKALF